MTRRHLLCVVGLYAVIQCCWFFAFPPFEGPDESQHYDVIRYVAVTGHLPDTVPAHVNEGNFFTGEWTQEGAYYWMLGLVLRQTGFQDTMPGTGQTGNRHAIWLGGGGAPLLSHTAPLAPHVAGGVRLMRLASIVFGLGTLIAVFAAVRLCTGDSRISTIVAGCVAMVPQFGVQHVLITNDTAATCWASIAAALTVWGLVRERPPTWGIGLAIGFTTGLAIASKLTAGVVIVAFPLALWCRRRDPGRLPAIAAWGAGLLATAGVAFGRNWAIFGDPLATPLKRMVVQQFDFHAQFNPRDPASYGALAKMLFHGIWGAFGWGPWTPPELWIQLLFGLFTALLLISLGFAIRIAWRRPARFAPRVLDALAVMLAVFLLHCAAYLVSISLFAGYTARYFLPQIVPFVTVAVIGARDLWPFLGRRVGSAAARWMLVAVPVLLAMAWIGTFTSTIIAFAFEGL